MPLVISTSLLKPALSLIKVKIISSNLNLTGLISKSLRLLSRCMAGECLYNGSYFISSLYLNYVKIVEFLYFILLQGVAGINSYMKRVKHTHSVNLIGRGLSKFFVHIMFMFCSFISKVSTW